MTYRIGLASSDGKVVNQHFGRATRFYIVEVDEKEEYKLVDMREVDVICQGGNHDENMLLRNIKILSDCQYLVVSKIGITAENILEQRGIHVYEIADFITLAVQKLISYIEVNEMINDLTNS